MHFDWLWFVMCMEGFGYCLLLLLLLFERFHRLWIRHEPHVRKGLQASLMLLLLPLSLFTPRPRPLTHSFTHKNYIDTPNNLIIVCAGTFEFFSLFCLACSHTMHLFKVKEIKRQRMQGNSKRTRGTEDFGH